MAAGFKSSSARAGRPSSRTAAAAMLNIELRGMTVTSDVRAHHRPVGLTQYYRGAGARLNAALKAGCFPAAVDVEHQENPMDRRLVAALSGAAALVVATGLVIATAGPRGAIFIAGDQPVTEAQVREKLQSEGYTNVQIVRQGNYFEAVGLKDGKTGKLVVDARTGRLADDDDDDD